MVHRGRSHIIYPYTLTHSLIHLRSPSVFFENHVEADAWQWMNVVGNLPSVYNLTLTLAIYGIVASAQGNASLGTARAFTSLALMSLLADTAASLLVAVPVLAASMGCFDRVQNFLTLPRRVDLRDVPSASTSSLPSETDVRTESKDAGIPMTHIKARDASVQSSMIVVEDLDVRPAPSADYAFRNVSFTVSTGSLTMIIGHVGSGKSVLLKALLGDTSFSKGSISITTTDLALCTQTPWLPNATIRQVICGPGSDPTEFDEKWYQQTLEACCLDYDISLLSDRDDTVIGSGGTALSGGQQHRIALARAVYSRAKLVILDDVLAALDAKTQRRVFERVLGENGLFKRLGSTVVLVTHAGMSSDTIRIGLVLTELDQSRCVA
jgi:ATP-binding cassette subfamily C (CFTR/MRP) protein 1